jgi:surface carbohydrate biosynthesis protein (TIGR04326 family)
LRPLDEILIWDSVESLPDCFEEIQNLVLWRSYITHGFSSAVSIPQLVEDHADVLRKRYLAWVHEIGETIIRGKRLIDQMQLRPGFSVWWMSLLAEKCNFAKSTQIDDAIRLLAFTDWMDKKNTKRMVLVSSNEALAECLKRWCSRKGIGFEWRRGTNKNISSTRLSWFYARLPHALRALIWLVYQFQSRRILRRTCQKSWGQSQGKITFVSYLLNLGPESASQDAFESGYWGNLPEMLRKKGVPSNWLHIYVKDGQLPTAKDAAEQIRLFNQTGTGIQNHITLDSFFSFSVFGRVLRDWFCLLRNCLALRMHANMTKMGELDLWPLFKDDWKNSVFGVVSMSNALYLNLFESAFREISKQRIGVYLLENQGWESGMRHAWKSNQHGQIIGCAHSTVRYWDLRYFYDPRSYNSRKPNPMPIPDRVAVNGPVAREAYLECGYPEADLVEVEALRYLHLDKIDNKQIMLKSISGKPLKVLILGDYLPSKTLLQMKLLREISDDLSNIELTVKPHPACPIVITDYPELKLKLSDQSLSDLLGHFDIAYTSSVTSASVDAYCAGLQVISVLDPTTLNLSPLRGFAGVRFVSSAEMLRDVLLDAPSWTGDVRESVDYFYVDSSLPRWQAFLSDNLECKR